MDGVRIVVAQLGAREHYGIARMAHAHASLARLHTDFWCPIPKTLQPLAKRLGGAPIKRAIGRFSGDIPKDLVRTHTLKALYWRARLRRAGDRFILYDVHRRMGRHFANSVAHDLETLDFEVFFGFSSAALECLHAARRKGALAIVDEFAPTHLEEEILAAERAAHRGWEPEGEPIGRAFLDRLEEEWHAADRIVVNSAWTRSALCTRDVAFDKIHIVPLTYDRAREAATHKCWRPGSKLKVLWLGTLCLRKGLPYAVEAARRLAGRPVHFTFAGPAEVDLRLARLPSNCTYAGPIPRIETGRFWAAHHVFLLPTLSDGFAITQLEAMAHGLPVIATACCGEVVEDGLSGQIVAPRDPRAIVAAIERILDGEVDLEASSNHALLRAQAFAPKAVWPRLRTALMRDTPPDDAIRAPHQRTWACGS